jgi:hypothetical protein
MANFQLLSAAYVEWLVACSHGTGNGAEGPGGTQLS